MSGDPPPGLADRVDDAHRDALALLQCAIEGDDEGAWAVLHALGLDACCPAAPVILFLAELGTDLLRDAPMGAWGWLEIYRRSHGL